MIYIGTQQMVAAYRDDRGVNQSSLKDLEEGLDPFLVKVEKRKEEDPLRPKPYFIIGGGVDTILTGVEGDFEKNYVVIGDSPTESIKNVVDIVFNNVCQNNLKAKIENIFELEYYTDFIEEACTETEYQKNWKMPTRIAKIIELGTVYFRGLSAAVGKIVLTSQQELTIQNIVQSLKNNPRTKGLFDREFFTQSTEVDIYYQLPVFFDVQGVRCKALLDIVIVEKTKEGKVKKAYPIDLKTLSGYTINFKDSVDKRRYDIQAAWYTEALLSDTATSPIKEFPFGEINADTIAPFKFVVESTTNVGKPLKFTLSENYLKQGVYGKLNKYTGSIEKKGYLALLQDYVYQQDTGWKEEAIVTRDNGDLTLDVTGLV